MKINTKRVFWIATILIAMLAAGYFLFFKKGSYEVVATCDKIVKETLIKKVSATGTINPIEKVEIGTQVSGTISKMYVDFNDQVKAGQVIAKMDTRNLIALVSESKANLSRAQIQLDQAKRALDRTSELFKNGMVAEIDMENAKDNYQLALATRNSSKLQLERNNINLEYATIRSPIDGIVISRKVDEGQTVAAAFATPAIYVIANDLKKMKIEASVDEADIGQVKKGQFVEFMVDAYPEEIFHGTVEEIQLEPVTIQNVVTYVVEIIIDNATLKLMPGMTATLEIIVTTRENVLTVPNGVFGFTVSDELMKKVRNEGYTVTPIEPFSQKTIWKKQGKSFIEVAVKEGYSNGIKTEITGEVKEGDEIVNSIEIVEGGKKKATRSFMMPQKKKDDQKKESDEAHN